MNDDLNQTLKTNARGLGAASTYGRATDETLPLPSPERLRAATAAVLAAIHAAAAGAGVGDAMVVLRREDWNAIITALAAAEGRA